MGLMRKVLVKTTAINLKDYLDDKHGIDADVYDLMDIINAQIGFTVDALQEQADWYEALYRDIDDEADNDQ